jgi:hypothetical protein
MRISIIVGSAMLAGCIAADPARIPATSVSAVGYSALACPSLAAEDARVAGELGPLTYFQSRRRDRDILGAMTVGVTASALGSSDHSSAIARLKGERETIASVMRSKGCPQPQAPIDTSWQAAKAYEERQG